MWEFAAQVGDAVCLDTNAVPHADQVVASAAGAMLLDSVEVDGDELGDDDLRCESSERCVVSANVGAYQGHGSLVGGGSFVDGVIVDVTLVAPEANGVR